MKRNVTSCYALLRDVLLCYVISLMLDITVIDLLGTVVEAP